MSAFLGILNEIRELDRQKNIRLFRDKEKLHYTQKQHTTIVVFFINPLTQCIFQEKVIGLI